MLASRFGRIAQLARALPLQGRCRGFESLCAHFVMSRDIGNGPDLHHGPDRLIFRGPLGPPGGRPVPWYRLVGLMVRVRMISPVAAWMTRMS
jgi:hypothetical protein